LNGENGGFMFAFGGDETQHDYLHYRKIILYYMKTKHDEILK